MVPVQSKDREGGGGVLKGNACVLLEVFIK